MAWIGFCVVVTAFYAVTTPKEFVATTQLILDSRRLSQGIETSAYAPMTIDNPQVESQVQIARSEQVLRLVFRELNLGADPEFMPGDVYLNSQGLMMTKMPRPDQEYKAIVDAEDEVEFSFPAARGEPVRVLLTTPDGKLVIPGTIVPFPIQGRDRQCKLEARLALPEAAAVLIYADGLAPNSDIPYQSFSEGQSRAGTLHTNAHGHAVRIDLPYVAGKDSGNLKVAIATKECSASVEIPWGKGSYKPF